jgi:hypothetical protein
VPLEITTPPSQQATLSATPSEAEIDAGISIAETQLQLQAALFGSLDATAAGLLGFDGVLIGVDIATQAQLGSHWWFPLPGFARRLG